MQTWRKEKKSSISNVGSHFRNNKPKARGEKEIKKRRKKAMTLKTEKWEKSVKQNVGSSSHDQISSKTPIPNIRNEAEDSRTAAAGSRVTTRKPDTQPHSKGTDSSKANAARTH